MFRFSVDRSVPVAANADQLAAAGITPDEDFADRLQASGEAREGERIYRVENEAPESAEEAVAYVQGVIAHVPARVWIGEEVYSRGDVDLGSVRKPAS